MLHMKDPSTQVEDHLAIQAAHSAHLRIFLKDPVVSPIVIHSEVPRPVIRLEAFPAAIPLVAVSPVEAAAFMVGAAIDNKLVAESSAKRQKRILGSSFFISSANEFDP